MALLCLLFSSCKEHQQEEEAALKKARLLFEKGVSLKDSLPEVALAHLRESTALFDSLKSYADRSECELELSKTYYRLNLEDSCLYHDSLALQYAIRGNSALQELKSRYLMAIDLDDAGFSEAALQQFEAAENLLKEHSLKEEGAALLLQKGLLHQSRLEFYKAMESMNAAGDYARQTGQTKRLAHINYLIANIYLEIGKYQEALQKHLEAVAIREQIKDEKGLCESYISIAVIYAEMQDNALKLKYDQKALNLARKLNMKSDEANVLSNIGSSFIAMHQIDSAIFYMRAALEKHLQSGNKTGARVDYNNLGFIFTEANSLDSAAHYLSLALQMGNKDAPDIDLASTYDNLARLYLKQGKLKEAETHFLQSLTFLEQNGYKDAIHPLRVLPSLYRQLGDLSKAYTYHEKYIGMKDSLFNEDLDRNIIRLTTKYEIDKKEVELQLSEKDKELLEVKVNERERSLFLLGLACVLLLVLATSVFFSWRRKTSYAKTLELKNDQIENLMTEMHHRVKNNFQALSDLFSLQVQQSDKPDGKLEDNKARIDALLLLHQQLSGNYSLKNIDILHYLDELSENIAFQFGYTPEVIKRDYRISSCFLDVEKLVPLGLIVNEIITNAFKHAFSSVDEPELNIKVTRTGDGKISIFLKDNGIASYEKIKNRNKSFGLNLVNIFARQLKARVDFKVDKGLEWEITFHPDAS